MENPVRKKEDFLIYSSPKIEDAEIDEVISIMKSGWLGSGPRVALFEDRFKAYRNSSHAIAVNSCTAAIHLSMIACNINPGDEVITTPMTFCSTVNAIIHAGGTPVLADIDPITLNINPVEIKRRLTRKTKAILPVHFAGRPCDMDAIMLIARENGLVVIEDCAHAIESEYKGQKTGTIGDFGCFSFYVTKNIVTGEGGMVLTQNEEHANRIKRLALHGMDKDAWKRFGDDGYKHYQVVECGFKYNMMDLQAGIGLQQLKRIEEYWKRREKIWNIYIAELSGLHVDLPASAEENTKHAYHLFTLQIEKKLCGLSRDEFINKMTAHNIGVGVHYQSIPEHPYYNQTFGWNPNDYPNAYQIGQSTVSLPISAKLTDKDVDDVIRAVKLIIKKDY
jgi:dTDP-4-amino-4,6-dideoxygalactose transaminase